MSHGNNLDCLYKRGVHYHLSNFDKIQRFQYVDWNYSCFWFRSKECTPEGTSGRGANNTCRCFVFLSPVLDLLLYPVSLVFRLGGRCLFWEDLLFQFNLLVDFLWHHSWHSEDTPARADLTKRGPGVFPRSKVTTVWFRSQFGNRYRTSPGSTVQWRFRFWFWV